MIVGAGLSGLIAAHAFPQMPILEAAREPREQHKALLRFRSDAVSKVTGIPFRKVRVRKGIWHDDQFAEPSIRLANFYSFKCFGKFIGDRSIWNLDAADRWIAPEDFYWQLLDSMKSRITWGAAVSFDNRDPRRDGPMISTAPMHVMADCCCPSLSAGLEFQRERVVVNRYRIPHADVHQTIYFPDPLKYLYRASITGDMLIAESVYLPGNVHDEQPRHELLDMCRAFGLSADSLLPLEAVSQRYGKIAPIDERSRKMIIVTLTNEHNIYCLGRFATWRNILLDDVVGDAGAIKQLIHASPYERKIRQS